MSSVPPLGYFLNPFAGFWQNAETVASATAPHTLNLPTLHDSVTIVYDRYQVPHIFARNDHDLYVAQGYVTARDRLWQMDFQTRAAGGRLSEVLGELTLEYDRFQRKVGMVYGAERFLEATLADSLGRQVIEAYTEGVNAWISQLTPMNYPIEFKLLDYKPEPWEPLKTALMLKLMTANLTMGTDDLFMTRILQQYGKATVDSLFPAYPYFSDPIIPPHTPWNFRPVPIPAAPTQVAALGATYQFPHRPDPDNGSNNWAISGERSATGYPILANDPHLGLSLPSLWYQVQLHAPGVNVCGASLPGTPGVIIGFNDAIAWGVTNVDADVLDFYKIDFRDDDRLEYRYLDETTAQEWHPVTLREERIKVRNYGIIRDTVRYTHHGPLLYNDPAEPSFNPRFPAGLAMRWIAHEPSTELTTFYKLNRAQDYQAFTEALSYYMAPAQNFVYADRDNNIALWVNGRFPLKWKEQGKFILEGSDPKNDWQGWIPHAHNPHVKNPPRGFVSSGNQRSTDRTYPYYLTWEQAPYGRGARINEVLRQMHHATADSLRALQNDNLYWHARQALPRMLQGVRAQQLTEPQQQVYAQMRRWNYEYGPGQREPAVFEAWWEAFTEATWHDELGDTLMRYPMQTTTLFLMDSLPKASWFDDRTTPERETLDEILHQTFVASVDTLRSDLGPWDDDWQWATVKGTTIRHLMPPLTSFGRKDIRIGGGAGIVNATKKTHGPSWRMIVELGPQVKAWGVYPGGQSGNPGSPFYENMIDTWRDGHLNELIFLPSPEAAPADASVWQLNRNSP
ncbi:penicillin acylase family protein [Catalinimonas alkaloidigena]|nr:penicillin acylase family protein [Catalinimonas alkaloidigena]